MTAFLYSLLLWIWENQSYQTIRQGNDAQMKAYQAYQQGNFAEAAKQYDNVLATTGSTRPQTRLYAAHAYFALKKYKLAKQNYRYLLKITDKHIVAQAYAQMGVIAAIEKDTLTALKQLEKALLVNADANNARHNYELLREKYSGKIIENNIKKEQKKESDVAQLSQNQTVAEALKTEERKQQLASLTSLNMTEAQALAILNTMQNERSQFFLKQRKSKPDASKGEW
jgi:tetratricopeptide (TPR) repeat protein